MGALHAAENPTDIMALRHPGMRRGNESKRGVKYPGESRETL